MCSSDLFFLPAPELAWPDLGAAGAAAVADGEDFFLVADSVGGGAMLEPERTADDVDTTVFLDGVAGVGPGTTFAEVKRRFGTPRRAEIQRSVPDATAPSSYYELASVVLEVTERGQVASISVFPSSSMFFV